MNQWFDIHSHIIPGIDDGSVSLQQTKNMLKIAYDEGIGSLFATPHYSVGCVNEEVKKLEEKLGLVKEIAKEIDPNFQVILGNELYYSEDIIGHLRQGKALTLGGTRYVLVEFWEDESYENIKTGIHRLLIYGYLPILSHIERYNNLVDDLEKIQKLVDLGAYTQINTECISRRWGNTKATKLCRDIIELNMLHFLGTNCHSDYKRGPYMRKGVAYLKGRFGEELIKRLLIENPKTLLKNTYIYN